MPARPAPLLGVPPRRAPALPRGVRETLPGRHASGVRRAAIGGHRVFLRTAEYADGRPAEVELTLPRDGAALRGLADALSSTLSVALQHGTPLEALLEPLAQTRFGAAGPVEGDEGVSHATSPVDYLARALARSYLGIELPAADPPEPEAPLLPLEIPREARAAQRRRSFRLVG